MIVGVMPDTESKWDRTVLWYDAPPNGVRYAIYAAYFGKNLDFLIPIFESPGISY